MSWQRLLATWFGAGLLRPGPGTWGTLAALPFAWALHLAGGFALLAAATVLVAGLGWYLSAHLTGPDNPDPSEIVIDEVASGWRSGRSRWWRRWSGSTRCGCGPAS